MAERHLPALENYTASVPAALQFKAVFGSVGEGRVSSANRADYADAAVAVLTAEASQAGKVYELAGGTSFSLAEFAAEIARQRGEPIVYTNLPEVDYKAALLGAGLPEPLAGLLAESDVGASKGALFGNESDLERLIGRKATGVQQAVADALAP